jgi:hypothetical protein
LTATGSEWEEHFMNRSLTWLMLACAFAVAASPRLSINFLPNATAANHPPAA